MKLATYSLDDKQHLGVVQPGLMIQLWKLGEKTNQQFPDSMLELIDAGQQMLDAISNAIRTANENILASCSLPLKEVNLLAPIPRPRKNIIGIGLNYTEHVAESARTLDTSNQLPDKPVIFSKPPTAVTGTQTDILHNTQLTQQLDWEVELAVIIGRKGKFVKREEALDYVFGYTVINDISARDCRRAGQWIVSKGQDTFAPMGPWIVTADEIADPHNLDLHLKLNGREMQRSNTRFMLFNINELIEDLSTVFTLEPGDIIATGTPAGVGAGRDPQQWMWDGDIVEATVEGIGTIVNTVREIKGR